MTRRASPRIEGNTARANPPTREATGASPPAGSGYGDAARFRGHPGTSSGRAVSRPVPVAIGSRPPGSPGVGLLPDEARRRRPPASARSGSKWSVGRRPGSLLLFTSLGDPSFQHLARPCQLRGQRVLARQGRAVLGWRRWRTGDVSRRVSGGTTRVRGHRPAVASHHPATDVAGSPGRRLASPGRRLASPGCCVAPPGD